MALWRSTIHGTLNGQTIDVNHGWQTGALTTSDRNDFASRIEDVWAAQIMPLLSNEYSVSEVRIVGVDDPTLFGVASSEATGGIDSHVLPAFCCVKVSLRTGLRGRSYQGRYGISGLVEYQTQESNGLLLEPGQRDSFQSAVEAFAFGVESGTISANAVVISTIHNGALRPAPIATNIGEAIVSLELGSRVSRKA